MANIVLTRSKYKKEIPLGLIVLKSYLDQTPHKSQIFDLSLEMNSIGALEELILKENIDFVGVSVGSVTHNKDLELIKRMKQRTKTIVGGAFAITPRVFDGLADHTILGRGEERLLKLLDEYEGIKSKSPNNRINLDLVNFNDYQFPRDFKGNHEFPLYTSMGCKFNCLYCSIPKINNHTLWFKDINIVSQEMEGAVLRDIRYLRFVDDLFGLDKNRTGFLLSQIKKIQGLSGIYTQLRVDCTNDELLYQMRDANFSGVYFGIESANEGTLKRIGKPYTLQKIREVLEVSRKLGFDITGAFTIGYPWETKGNIQDTLLFASEMRTQFDLRPSLYIVTPFAGTPLSMQVSKNKIRIRDYTLWDAKHAIMNTDHLIAEEIQELYDRFEAD